MPLVTLYIDNVRIRQRKMPAPRRPGDPKKWSRDALKLFQEELGFMTSINKDTQPTLSHLGEDIIRFAYAGSVGIVIDRRIKF